MYVAANNEFYIYGASGTRTNEEVNTYDFSGRFGYSLHHWYAGYEDWINESKFCIPEGCAPNALQSADVIIDGIDTPLSITMTQTVFDPAINFAFDADQSTYNSIPSFNAMSSVWHAVSSETGAISGIANGLIQDAICQMNGQLTIIDPNSNGYDIAVSFSNCTDLNGNPEPSDAFEGTTGTGFSFIDFNPQGGGAVRVRGFINVAGRTLDLELAGVQ
jgi:hypothetical protein